MRYKLILIFVWILTSPVLANQYTPPDMYNYNVVNGGEPCPDLEYLFVGTFAPMQYFYNGERVFRMGDIIQGIPLYYTGTNWRIPSDGTSDYPVSTYYYESTTSSIIGTYLPDAEELADFRHMVCPDMNAVVSQGNLFSFPAPDLNLPPDDEDYNNLPYNGNYCLRMTNSYEINFPLKYFQIGLKDFTVCYWFNVNWGSLGKNYTGFVARQSWGPEIAIGFDGSNYDGNDANRVYCAMGTLMIDPYLIHTRRYDIDVKNRWVHIAMSADRDSNVILYLNGQEIARSDISLLADINYTPSIVGITYGGSPSHRPDNISSIDDFRFYDGNALSPSNIADIYNNGHGTKVSQAAFSALCSNGIYYSFDTFDALMGYAFGKAEVNGVFTNYIKVILYVYYGLGEYDGYVAGGVPFGSSVNRRKVLIDFRGW